MHASKRGPMYVYVVEVKHVKNLTWAKIEKIKGKIGQYHAPCIAGTSAAITLIV